MIVKRLADPPKYRYGGSSRSNYSKYRYGGNGIFSNLIGRKLLHADNVKNLINTVSKSNIIQKATNAVQDGASSVLKWQAHQAIQDLVSKLISKKKSKKKKKNLAYYTIPTTTSIEGIVRKGSGIVYDYQ